MSGKSIAFTLDGNPVGSATTGVDGVATLTGVPLTGKSATTHTGVVGASFTTDTTYSGNTGSGDLTVGKKSIDGSFVAADKTYDGTTAASITRQVDATDIVGTDEVSLDPTQGTASFADANVAYQGNTVADKVVTGSNFALTGAQAGNYTLVMDNTDDAEDQPEDPERQLHRGRQDLRREHHGDDPDAAARRPKSNRRQRRCLDSPDARHARRSRAPTSRVTAAAWSSIRS